MTKTFIIILSFNGGKDIIECLKSLKRKTAEVAVVDNRSTDNSVELIRKNFPRVKIIENKKNLGFARGCNVGIRYALKQGAGSVVLLNPDTVVEKRFLRSFLKPLLKNRADIVAPVIKFKRAGEWVYDLGGKVNWWLGRPKHLESNKKGDRKQEVDYVSGCAMLVKQPVFEKIGFLDEKFFLYFEDVDFCLRAKKAGFKIAVEPKSVVVHKLVESKKKPFKQQLHLLKSNLLFIKRHVLFWRKPLAISYWWLLLVKIIIGRLR